MKIFKYLLTAYCLLLTAYCFAQPGSLSQSVYRTRVNDSTAAISANTSFHSSGYADIWWNNQDSPAHWMMWDGSQYVDPLAGGITGATNGLQVIGGDVGLGGNVDIPTVIDIVNDGIFSLGDYTLSVNGTPAYFLDGLGTHTFSFGGASVVMNAITGGGDFFNSGSSAGFGFNTTSTFMFAGSSLMTMYTSDGRTELLGASNSTILEIKEDGGNNIIDVYEGSGNRGVDILVDPGNGFTSNGFRLINGATTVFQTDINNTLRANVKLTATRSATDASINFVPLPGDPSSVFDGDVWYNNTTNTFRARQNGVSVDMIGGGGGISAADNGLYNDGGTVKLGTNPLTENTSIDVTGFDFEIVTTGGNGFIGINVTEDLALAGSTTSITATNEFSLSWDNSNFNVYADNVGFELSTPGGYYFLGASDFTINATTNTISGNSTGLDLIFDATSELRIDADPGTSGEVLTSQGAGLPPVWAPGGGGGGISNGAAVNEIPKTIDGSGNLDASGVFSTTNGNIILGSSSIAGSRTLSIESSTANAGLVSLAQGTGDFRFSNTATSTVGVIINPVPASGAHIYSTMAAAFRIDGTDGTTGQDLELTAGRGSAGAGGNTYLRGGVSLVSEANYGNIFAETNTLSLGIEAHSTSDAVTFRASNGNSGDVAGLHLNINGGAGYSVSGNNNGGNIRITGGLPRGTGDSGDVYISGGEGATLGNVVFNAPTATSINFQSAEGINVMHNATTDPTTAIADAVAIYSDDVDTGGGDLSLLSWYQEHDVEVGTFDAIGFVVVKINGVAYWLQLFEPAP